ncbi:hypothetical protein [Streptomyces sp. NPDC021562]
MRKPSTRSSTGGCAVDGELGSKVLADIAAILEHPRRLITWG